MATSSFAPAIVSRIMGEIRDLFKAPPEGISYEDTDSDSTLSEIYAVISGPEGTPFSGGRFRVKLVLSEDYPNSPPRGYFLTKCYHPNIANNGDICVNTLKKDWNADVTIKHVFQVIRCLLIVPFPESSLNDEAGKLFMDSYEEFARRARIMTDVHAMPEETTADDDEMEKGGHGPGKEAGRSGAENAVPSNNSASVVIEDSHKGGIDDTKSKKKPIDTKKKILKRL